MYRTTPRILLVADNASLRFGGEATKPFLLFRFFRRRGLDVRLLVHARCWRELTEAFPEDVDRIHFVSDTAGHRMLCRVGKRMPARVNTLTLASIGQHLTQLMQRSVAQDLVRRHRIDVVHQPTPISPKQVSVMHGLGAPVVIGPMCGGMGFPPGFEYMQGHLERQLERLTRAAAQVLHEAAPGKLRADALIVANERTRLALPRGTAGTVYQMPESGVELATYQPIDYAARRAGGPVRFVFLGRLVDWKGVDVLLDAFAGVARREPRATLDILGAGPLLEPLQRRSAQLGIAERVQFAGWVSKSDGLERLRAADAFVLPSVRECGGNALLEAMAVGLPSIVANWGGPGEYVDDTCGFRIEPSTRSLFIEELTAAMLKLAASRELRVELGQAARRRLATGCFTWESKVERMLEIYHATIEAARTPKPRPMKWLPSRRPSVITAPA